MEEDIVEILNHYANDSGYSHNDYSDIMRKAAKEIEAHRNVQAAMAHTLEKIDEMLGINDDGEGDPDETFDAIAKLTGNEY